MDWKELVMSVLGAEEGRQDLLSEVAGLEKRKRTLEDRLEELESSRPWEDKARNIFSRLWGYLAYDPKPTDKARQSLLQVKGQLDPLQKKLGSLEEGLKQKAREYLLANPGFDEAYTVARGHVSQLTSLAYRIASLHTNAEEAAKNASHAKQDYEYNQKPGWDTDDWWLRWAEGWLRSAKRDVESLAHYDGLVRQISAYLPGEAQALENDIKLARMLNLDHLECLGKAVAHLQGFEGKVTMTKKALQKLHGNYTERADRQVSDLLDRIRKGAF